MSEILNQFSDNFLVGPVWPATVLLALMIMYAAVAALGLGDFDLGIDADLDLDVDVDVPDIGVDVDVPDLDAASTDIGAHGAHGAMHGPTHGLLGSLGAFTIRWSNFGRVPVAIWGGIFTLALWGIAFTVWHSFDVDRYSATLLPSILLTIRNAVVAVMITKVFTQPMAGKFDKQPGYDSRRIIGSTAEISSIEASPSFGQAKFRTNAAPLLLNVRTDGPTIPRGTEVKIVDFNPHNRIYTVTNITSESQS